MKRFLMLLALAAVTGATYAAAAPGSSPHAGPTWQQFMSLKKQLAAVKKKQAAFDTQLTYDSGYVDSWSAFWHVCMYRAGVSGVSPGIYVQRINPACLNPDGSEFIPNY